MFYPSFGTKQVEIFLFIKLKSAILIDKSRALKYLGHLTPEEMRRVDDAVRISLALNPMGSIKLSCAILAKHPRIF